MAYLSRGALVTWHTCHVAYFSRGVLLRGILFTWRGILVTFHTCHVAYLSRGVSYLSRVILGCDTCHVAVELLRKRNAGLVKVSAQCRDPQAHSTLAPRPTCPTCHALSAQCRDLQACKPCPLLEHVCLCVTCPVTLISAVPFLPYTGVGVDPDSRPCLIMFDHV